MRNKRKKPYFPFEKIMETCRDVLRDSEQEYADVVSNNAITMDS